MNTLELKNIPIAAMGELLARQSPALLKYQGKIMVIKYGGNAMTEAALQKAFARDIVLLKSMGILPVVVHGGGPQIESALQLIGKKGEFIQGMRVTDAQTMQVVRWVLMGEVQQDIVGFINQEGGCGVGLSGRDGCLFQCKPLKLPDQHNPKLLHDIGFVGEITSCNVEIIHNLHQKGYIPVVSPVGVDEHNISYNVNADVVASQLAVALGAEKLLMLTNIRGVLDKSGELIAQLTAERIEQLCNDGTISGGMIPKIDGALQAAKSGVKTVHIIDGRQPHMLLLEILLSGGFGTAIANA